MKNKKLLKKILQIPLRFHHQDLHEELCSIAESLGRIQDSIDSLSERLDCLEGDTLNNEDKYIILGDHVYVKTKALLQSPKVKQQIEDLRGLSDQDS